MLPLLLCNKILCLFYSGNCFIKLILEKNMSISVINTLKHDNDPFVRSKALECLEEMVSVSEIWEMSLKDSDLLVSV
jgi:hypothetical protein